jgi:hypothetical protein
MGYTHYFTIKKEVEQEVWNEFLKDVKKLYKAMPEHSHSSGDYYSEMPLALSGCFKYEKPQFTKEHIYFNGSNGLKRIKIRKQHWEDSKLEKPEWNDLGHETFVLNRKGCEEFCKTARKPYDLMVQAVLIIAKYYFQDNISIGSDGDMDDWREAIKFVCETDATFLSMAFTDLFKD